MKAAVLAALATIEVREIQLPPLRPGEVLVGINVALTDGTDRKAFRRGHLKMPMPTRFGHEFSGDVLAVAPDVTTFLVGDRIMTVHSAPCNHCYWCDAAQHELCETLHDRLVLGAYAEAIVLPAEIVALNAYRIPEHLSYEAAAFLEPLSCVFHAWQGITLSKTTSVAIYGLGGFAILHAMALRAMGVEHITLIGRNKKALDRAKSLCNTNSLDSENDDVKAAIYAQTGGRGADIIVECTGSLDIWQQSLGLVRRGGIVLLFGGLASGTVVQFDAARLHYDEISIRSPFHLTPRSVRQAYEKLAAGQIDPRPLITASYPLNDIQAAFQALETGSELKIAIYPGRA